MRACRCRECGGRPRGGYLRQELCGACYDRWLRAGKPEGVPVPWSGKRGRVEDYAELRLERHLSVAAAALRLRVCQRTAERYEAELRRVAS